MRPIPLFAAPFVAALSTAAFAAPPTVVTDIPPVQSLVAQVMEGVGTPALLLDRGANAHDFQLRPSHMSTLGSAGLVVWVGPEMTPWLDRVLDQAQPKGARLELLGVAGTQLRAYGDHEGHDHDHEAAAQEGHDHDDHAAEGHDHDAEAHDHDHTGKDPHAWLDPANAQTWLRAIAAELSRIDPDNAATYGANADKAVQQVAALDAELAAGLAPVKDRPFVVFHDAYGYLTDHYGLHSAGAIAFGDAAAPGAAHLAELRDLVTTLGPICIFPEENHDPKLATIIANDTGATMGQPLDPEGSTIEPGPALYGTLMRGLADTLETCLSAQ